MNDQQMKEFPLFTTRDDLEETDRACIRPLLSISDRQMSEVFQPLEKFTEQISIPSLEMKTNERSLSMEKKTTSKIRILLEKISRIQMTKHALIMIIVNILMLGLLIVVSQLSNRSSIDIPIDTEEIMVVKRGEPFGGPGGDDLHDDAEIATLKFNDTITRVMASQSVDLAGEPLLLSLTFGYSNDRLGREYGGLGRVAKWEDLNSLELAIDERIDRITIYEGYRNITNPYRDGKLTYIIVGIFIKTDHNQEILYGSRNGIQKNESPLNYFLAYVQGRAGGHIDSLRFTWYKYCLKNETITEGNIL